MLQSFAPGDCLLTGLCGIKPVIAALPSGLGFVALALVLYGAVGIRRLRSIPPRNSPSSATPPDRPPAG